MKKITVSIALLFVVFKFSLAQNVSADLVLKHFNLDEKVALSGYDPVSYFTGSNPQKGSETFRAMSQGVFYNFASEANRKLFVINPEKYKPQYGGWCAFAMGSKGEKVEVDPKTFKITEGKLYLFYNAFFNNTLKDWNKDESNLRMKADKNWKNIFK